MKDVKSPENQAYVNEKLQEQLEQITERIILRHINSFYKPDCADIEFYTGLSREKIAGLFSGIPVRGCKIFLRISQSRDFFQRAEHCRIPCFSGVCSGVEAGAETKCGTGTGLPSS